MTTSPSTSLSPSCCSSTLQEGDGVRKSGPIVLLSCSKKKGQPLYAVLSERALELHESEKAQRKKKGTKSIVDLSKCFNVSQQICPKSKASCVCLLMPDECFIFRGENTSDTADWYSSLLFAVISARALHLGRPVFPNEFFESVWDVTIVPAQPKLKMPHHNPDNSPNICAKLPHLAGRRRLCFYPHTIIICKIGVEPANSGLPKSGIPPFRTTDFVEFSRHFIASYGSQEKYFIMRIGRGSPMGTCEVWVQCESDECAAEVMNKLTEIIRRETEKKQCALMALGNIVRGSSSSASSSSGTTSYVTPAGCSGASSSGGSPSSKGGDAMIGGAGGAELETISEDEQLPSPGGNNQQPQQQQPQQERSPSTSISSSSGRPARKKHSSLSASAREKRLELRECKAKVDSLEEEEQRFREQQQQRQQQQEGDWRRGYLEHHRGVGAVQGPGSSSACSSGSGLIPHSHSRPAYLGCQPDGKLFRRRGSATSMESATLRSKSTSLEQQQSQPPLGTRNYNRRSPMELNNNTIDDFDVRWMDRTDSLNLFYNPEEETEDSGGTLRIPCADGEENNSQENSRSASSLNLHNNGNNNGQVQQHGQTQRNLVEALVECHAVGSGGSEDEQRRMAGDEHHQRQHKQHQHQAVHGGMEDEEDTSTEEECDGKASSTASQSKRIDLAAVRHRRSQQQQQQQHNPNDAEQYTAVSARRQRQMTAESSQEAAEEADQSCCSSSIASTSSVTGGREEAHLNHQPIANEQHHLQQYPVTEKDDQHHEYTMMDKVSCSSDSFSHLAVPQQWDRQQTMATCCPEEICSCNSDSGDSCYSSMVNGQLNPRALSFSSAVTDGSCGAGNGHGHRVSGGGHGRGARGPEGRHWTMGMVSGMGAHRNGNNGGGAANPAHVLANPTHFSPPNHPTSAMLPPPNNNNNSSIPDSSSSSRFSMETSLITPLEEELDERRVNFLDNEERDKLDTELVKRGADELRKRAFSLGSKSWITKPFRKLSSTHGPNAVSASTSQHHHHRQVRNSRSGNSSLAGSVHADLSAQPDQNSSQTRLSLSQRLGSSSSFASSSVAGHHNRYRSDSIGSSHSAAFSLPGVSQRVLRKKGPSDEHLPNEDLVELEFMPTTPTSAHSPKPMMVNVATEAPVVVRTNTRARTSSYDEPATILYQQQPGTPRGRASAGALDYKMPKVQRGTGTGGSCSWMMTSPREQQQHAQPHHHQQQQQQQRHQQRLRPSESFIRSIQQKQQELQRVRQQQQQQKRPMSRSDFPLQEVQCFIAPAEKEKIDAITARDSHSMHSQRSGSGSTFETIQEGCSTRQQQQSPNHRPSRNRQSSSRASSSMASTGSQHKLCPENEAEEDEYVLGSADSALRVKA